MDYSVVVTVLKKRKSKTKMFDRDKLEKMRNAHRSLKRRFGNQCRRPTASKHDVGRLAKKNFARPSVIMIDSVYKISWPVPLVSAHPMANAIDNVS